MWKVPSYIQSFLKKFICKLKNVLWVEVKWYMLTVIAATSGNLVIQVQHGFSI